MDVDCPPTFTACSNQPANGNCRGTVLYIAYCAYTCMFYHGTHVHVHVCGYVYLYTKFCHPPTGFFRINIFEYHRVELNQTDNLDGSAYVLTPLPSKSEVYSVQVHGVYMCVRRFNVYDCDAKVFEYTCTG